MPEYLTLMPDDLLLSLLGLLAFLIPLLVQLPLCALTKGIARRAGLLFPLLWLAAALWALLVFSIGFFRACFILFFKALRP